MRFGGPVVPLVSMRTATPGPTRRRVRPPPRTRASMAVHRARRARRARSPAADVGVDDASRSSGSPTSKGTIERSAGRRGAVRRRGCGFTVTTHAPARSTPRSSADRGRSVAQHQPDRRAGAEARLAAQRRRRSRRRSRQIAARSTSDRRTPAPGASRVERHDRGEPSGEGRSPDPRAWCGRCPSRSISAAPIGLPSRVYIRPCSIAARYGLSSDSQIARTVPCVATVGYDAMSRASAWARATRARRARPPR